MDAFIAQCNIARFTEQLKYAADEADRRILQELLDEEQRRLELAERMVRNSGADPAHLRLD